jgi:NADH:ubiquinone oxidoreductase subunit F (NADH-binding)
MQPAEIVAVVTESGLRGRGGAGFPTGIKWKTTLEAQAPQTYIVCNADEGDSGTFADRMIMEGDPFVLIEGMAIAGIATGATTGSVQPRSEYPDAIAIMNEARPCEHASGATVAVRRWLGPTASGGECLAQPRDTDRGHDPSHVIGEHMQAHFCAYRL